jgi:hypothetical protein
MAHHVAGAGPNLSTVCSGPTGVEDMFLGESGSGLAILSAVIAAAAAAVAV